MFRVLRLLSNIHVDIIKMKSRNRNNTIKSYTRIVLYEVKSNAPPSPFWIPEEKKFLWSYAQPLIHCIAWPLLDGDLYHR